jgi:hypothetical protein
MVDLAYTGMIAYSDVRDSNTDSIVTHFCNSPSSIISAYDIAEVSDISSIFDSEPLR